MDIDVKIHLEMIKYIDFRYILKELHIFQYDLNTVYSISLLI